MIAHPEGSPVARADAEGHILRLGAGDVQMTKLGVSQTTAVAGVPNCAAVDKALGYGADSFVAEP